MGETMEVVNELKKLIDELAGRLKFVEYKQNLIMENLEVLSDGKKKKSVMDLWKSRGRKVEEEVK